MSGTFKTVTLWLTTSGIKILGILIGKGDDDDQDVPEGVAEDMGPFLCLNGWRGSFSGTHFSNQVTIHRDIWERIKRPALGKRKEEFRIES